jgi:hypothetical protein
VPTEEVVLPEAVTLSPTFFDLCRQRLSLRPLSVQHLVDHMAGDGCKKETFIQMMMWLGSLQGKDAINAYLIAHGGAATTPVHWLLEEQFG